MKNIAGDI